MVTDHAIFAALYAIARKFKIRTILSRTNAATESVMPRAWQHLKFDLLNLKSIHKRFGEIPITNYPTMSIWKMGIYNYSGLVKSVSLLNYIAYRKTDAMKILHDELDWQYYGGNHYESTFTK